MKEEVFMPINRENQFPCFDVNNPKAVLDIPDNIEVEFGGYKFSFSKGTKEGRISKNRNEWQYNGDYFIQVNGKSFSDSEIINMILEKKDPRINQFIKQEINIIRAMNIEKNVFDRINNYNFSSNSDFIKMVLYYCWHRCQVEDRLYPSQIRNQMGNQMFIDGIMQI
jgi:hypothetical protein